MRGIITMLAVVVAVGLVVAGCGTTTRTVTDTVTQTVTRTVAAPPSATAPSHSSASGGSAPTTPAPASSGGQTIHDFSGNALSVKADGFIDPATPTDPSLGPKAGSRIIAVVVTLTGRGPGTVSSDANANMTLLGTDGQGYTADFDPVTECTNFSHGVYTLLNGDTEKGCVVFQVPIGVNVKAVQFALDNNTVQFNNNAG